MVLKHFYNIGGKMMAQIKIIDYGSQYTHLIKSRLRELGHDAKILPPDANSSLLRNAAGIVLSGGPYSVYEQGAPQLSNALARLIFEKEIPTLGICYGMQAIAQHAARKYYPAVEKRKIDGKEVGEYGKTLLNISCAVGVLKGLKKREVVWMSHGDSVVRLPPDFQRLDPIKDRSQPENYPPLAMSHITKPIFGLQFHPEVSHTLSGQTILRNFLEICGAEQNWNPKKALARISREAKKQISGRHVFGFISGGNDSSVLALLLKQIVPKDRLHLFYVRGLGDNEDLKKIKQIGNVAVIDARNKFYKALKGLIDPEEKRKAIGEVFEKVFRQKVKVLAVSLGCNVEDLVLAQGTIYPDVIESGGSRHADKIKSHHNLMISGEIVEPFRALFKPDIRKIGRMLGINEELISQHPFPGPGYAVRFLCSDDYIMPHNKEFREAVDSEWELMDICRLYGYRGAILPVKSKGVGGDKASYLYTAVISGNYDWPLLTYTASLLPERLRGKINRVLFLVHPANLSNLCAFGLHKDYFRKETRDILAKANGILINGLKEATMYKYIGQAFVVLAPLSFDMQGYSAIIRAVNTDDFMTASPYLFPQEFIENIARRIMESVSEVQAVFYDLSTKPPGTIEWE